MVDAALVQTQQDADIPYMRRWRVTCPVRWVDLDKWARIIRSLAKKLPDQRDRETLRRVADDCQRPRAQYPLPWDGHLTCLVMDAPDRDLHRLRERVAVSTARWEPMASLAAEEVAACPAGTILLDRHPHDPEQYGVWVRVDGGLVARIWDTFEPDYREKMTTIMHATRLLYSVVAGDLTDGIQRMVK